MCKFYNNGVPILSFRKNSYMYWGAWIAASNVIVMKIASGFPLKQEKDLLAPFLPLS